MMLRNTLLLALLITVISARAQQSQFHYFEAAQPVGVAQLKHLTEALASVDANAEIFHSDDMRILQLKSSTLQPESHYRAVIQARGIVLLPGTRTADELGINNQPAVPVFVPTGDEPADMARYRAAVEQWNALHPEAPLSTTPIHHR